MPILYRFALLGVLALLLCGTSTAQTVPAASNLPWNNYTPVRIPDGFESIIGGTGTTQLMGTVDDQLSTLPLPFPFYFIDQTYEPGHPMKVSSNGFIAFNGGTGAGTFEPYLTYTTSTTISYYNRVISAWWYDLWSTGITDGGVYYRVDGADGARVLTVEWRMARYLQTAPGNFQVKLFERGGAIEWHYGESSISLPTGASDDATAIGIKKFGQSTGVPTGDDTDKFLLFANPEATPGTFGYTSLRVFDTQPDYYRSTGVSRGAEVGPYFFSEFPTAGGQRISLRASRVLNDVAVDSVLFGPVQVANAYGVGSSLTVSARVVNTGANPRQGVPVRADVYHNGSTLVASRSTTVWTDGPASQFTTATITFSPAITSAITNNTGEYSVKVYTQLAGDEDAMNDTAKGTFYISKSNDVMPYAILQPFSNVEPLFNKYPVNTGVPIEIRYLNIGTRPQSNVTVGYQIVNEGGAVVASGTSIVNGTWAPLTYRDVFFPAWTPTQPGNYYVRAITMLPGDEQPFNDTVPRSPAKGKQFDVRHEIEVAAGGASFPQSPAANGAYPIGRPIKVNATYTNSGVADATSVPARLQITGPTGAIVYDRTVLVSDIVGDGGQTLQEFPGFTPQGAGRYCVTSTIGYFDDPVTGNDTARWCFDVQPALAGTIRVGSGGRFRTIQEARDSLFYFGVSGPVTFELIDDGYTVATNEATTPALDLRGRIVGVGSTNTVTWRPGAGKSLVTINLASASGIGIWLGQLDTSNPSGWMTFDGGTGRALKVTYRNTNTSSIQPAFNRVIPFFLGQGASNYTIKNVKIEPVAGGGRKSALTIPMVRYNPSFNEFTYAPDVNMTISAGIMLRNSIVDLAGRLTRPDTLRNQNNTLTGNEIRDFGYGIVSVGAGPLFVVGTGTYVEYSNQDNKYNGNLIEDVSRGGVVVVFEKGSEIVGNTIRRVENETTTPHAAAIWATAGGNPANNRGYSTDLVIEKNRISNLVASAGNGAAIWIETAENLLVTPANLSQRFPIGSATNMRIRNNMAWDYAGAGTSFGVGLTAEAGARPEMLVGGNGVENNTFYNQVAGSVAEYGIWMHRAAGSVRNNIVASVSRTGDPIGLVIVAPGYRQAVTSDYNAFWVPYGHIGRATNLSAQGYALPSPPIAKTLNQWRALTGLDVSSVEGDVTGEFVSSQPGSIDLHIDHTRLGSIVNNRGAVIAGLTADIDGDPRGAAAVSGRYDIGADEFTGRVHNYDLSSEDVVAPFGYRTTAGQFGDAEYVMTDSLVPVKALVRNVGGMPLLANDVRAIIEWRNPTTGQFVGVFDQTKRTNVDVTSTQTVDFGMFMPKSLRELGLTDPFYGNNPNVSPIYRFRVIGGTDGNAANDTTVKMVRFYVQRSAREMMVAVENYGGWNGTTAVGLSNRLNADTLLAALDSIRWLRADGTGKEDFDLFERDRWPAEALTLTPWSMVIWAQGAEPQGLEPGERAALKAMLLNNAGPLNNTLVMAGQDVARIHDAALTATNGTTADQEFVRSFLRSEYRGGTDPAPYSNLRVRGDMINQNRFEELEPTGVTGDNAPMPSVLRLATGEGIARSAYRYADLAPASDGGAAEDIAGVASSATKRNVIYYAFDWRHAGRYDFEPLRSGAQRLLTGALDFADQYRGILPIEISAFSATQLGRQSVSVEWATTSEVSVTGMEIERATVTRDEAGEKLGSWSLVDRQAPKGTATSGARYNTVDREVELGREYSYRLISVELDGSRKEVASGRVLMLGGSQGAYALEIRPNPIRQSGSIVYRVPADESVRVALYDAQGRMVKTLEATNGEIPVNAGDLASGTYTVRMETSTGVVLTERLTIVK